MCYANRYTTPSGLVKEIIVRSTVIKQRKSIKQSKPKPKPKMNKPTSSAVVSPLAPPQKEPEQSAFFLTLKTSNQAVY